jgi:two-component system copper resistance phosphate regulon response regulator CusR
METFAKILLIEDDRRVSDTVKKGLLNKNFEVETAYDGFTAHDWPLQIPTI